MSGHAAASLAMPVIPNGGARMDALFSVTFEPDGNWSRALLREYPAANRVALWSGDGERRCC